MRRYPLLLPLLVLAALLALAGCRRGGHSPEASSSDAPIDVTVTVAARHSVADYTEVSGQVQPLRRAELAATVMARVTEVAVSEGDRVEPGQVLVRLDARRAGAEASRAAAQVRSARAAVEQSRLQERVDRAMADAKSVAAQQDLAMGETGARDEDKAQADEVVRQAQAFVSQAREQLDILREGSRRQERDTAAESVRQAEAQVAQAGQKLSAMEEGARPQERQQAASAVEQAEARLVSAQSALSELTKQRRSQAAEQVRMAEAAFETADATFRRLEALHQANVISGQRYDEAKLSWQQAKSQLEITRQEVSLVGDSDSAETVVRAKQAVEQARAGVVAARSQASLVEEGPRGQDIEGARQQVAQAEAGLAQARAQSSLVEEGPRGQEIQQAEEAVTRAEAALTIARKQREVAYAGARPEQLRQLQEAYRAAQTGELSADVSARQVEVAQAQVAFAAAAAQAASVVVDDHTIRAPFGGVVTKKMVDPGDMASPGIVLLVIEPNDQFRIHCDVPESQIADVRPNDTLPVEIDSVPGTRFLATVSSIIPAADPTTRTFLVKADLVPSAGLASGLFGRLLLPVGKREGVVVPVDARWQSESLTGVWVVGDGGTAELRLARFANADPGMLEALTGVDEGDRVVLGPSALLTDGSPVRVSSEVPLEGAARASATAESEGRGGQ
jgi:RND family efflux transporter MFP subunit